MKLRGRVIVLSSGRELSAEGGVIGIGAGESATIYLGYDDTYAPPDEPLYSPAEIEECKKVWREDGKTEDQIAVDLIADKPLTPDERRELAEEMIGRWKRWAGL